MEPREEPRDFPAQNLAAQLAAVLRRRSPASPTVGPYELHARSFQSRSSRASLWCALSPIGLSATSSMMLSSTQASTIWASWREALATLTARGRPAQSVAATIFIPLPRFVSPMAAPFSPSEVEGTSFFEVRGDRTHHVAKGAVSLPALHRLLRQVLRRQLVPLRTGPNDRRDRIPSSPRTFGRTSGPVFRPAVPKVISVRALASTNFQITSPLTPGRGVPHGRRPHRRRWRRRGSSTPRSPRIPRSK